MHIIGTGAKTTHTYFGFRSYYGGRDTDRFFGGAFEGDESDDDVDGVDDEPPAELVPLGMRGGSGSTSVRSPRNRNRSGSHQHKPGFYGEALILGRQYLFNGWGWFRFREELVQIIK